MAGGLLQQPAEKSQGGKSPIRRFVRGWPDGMLRCSEQACGSYVAWLDWAMLSQEDMLILERCGSWFRIDGG